MGRLRQVQQAVVDVLHDHGDLSEGRPNPSDPADCPRSEVHFDVARRVAETEVVGALLDVADLARRCLGDDTQTRSQAELAAALDRLDRLGGKE